MAVNAPTTLADVLALLRDIPAAQVLAGGTDFMVEVNFGHRRPVDVVSIANVAELQDWSTSADGASIRIGATVTFAEILRSEIAEAVPALAEAARTVGSPQIRNAATIGGNLGTCSPAGDSLPVLAALGAQIELSSVDGTRSVTMSEYMVGPKRSCRQPGELVTAVTVPIVQGWQGFAKVGTRNAMVIALANAAVVVDRQAAEVRVGLGSVGPVIIRPTAAERYASEYFDWGSGAHTASTGDATKVADAAQIAVEFGRLAAEAASPIDDHRSTAAYRRHAIGVITRRLLERAGEAMARA
jgi:CO/xanthine dehydrogenase FAD-binding subunit